MHSLGLSTHETYDSKDKIMFDDISDGCGDTSRAENYASIVREDKINADCKSISAVESIPDNNCSFWKSDKEQYMLGVSKHTKNLMFRQLRCSNDHLDCVASVLNTQPPREIMPRNEAHLSSSQIATLKPLPLCNEPSGNNKETFIPSTDRDSGMGSPVNSSRSTRFRRRAKHKLTLKNGDVASATTTTTKTFLNLCHMHGCTVHPLKSQQQETKGSIHIGANDRLMKIISAQDETIRKHLFLLREKECQIAKIEEEKHRLRERELGKNYLLETYFSTFDQAEYIDTAKNLENVAQYFEHEIHKEEPHSQEQKAADEAFVTPSDETQVLPTEDIDGKEWKSIALKTGYLDRRDENSAMNDDLQLYWLEKIHGLNKRLEYQEEFLLQLYIKVRKHQVKRAYQTKSGVLHQIDELDREIAAQVADIHCVERQLLTANEQLKAKLGVLECLSNDLVTCNKSALILTSNGNAVAADDHNNTKKGLANSSVIEAQMKFDAHILDNHQQSVVEKIKLDSVKKNYSKLENEDCESKQSFLQQQLQQRMHSKIRRDAPMTLVNNKDKHNEYTMVALPQFNLKSESARAVSPMLTGIIREQQGVSKTISKYLPRLADEIYDITSLGTLV